MIKKITKTLKWIKDNSNLITTNLLYMIFLISLIYGGYNELFTPVDYTIIAGLGIIISESGKRRH